jgi:hypothetical protein
VCRTILCLHQCCVPAIWLQPLPCACGLGWRPAQVVDQAKYAGKDGSRQCRFGELEDGVAGMAHQPGVGIDQSLLQRSQRPGLDGCGRRQRSEQIGEILGEGMQLVANRGGDKAHAGKPMLCPHRVIQVEC